MFLMICKECGEDKEHHAFGFCQKCYYKNWVSHNREKCKLIERRYELKNKDKICQRRKDNKKKISLQNHISYIKNKEKIRIHQRIYQLNREKTDINFRIRMRLSSRIKDAVKNQSTVKSKKTLELLGCSIQECRQYIEQQFKPDMTWDNYGQWQIHHIKSCMSFDLTKEEEQKKCFHYTNLQPLWMEEHQKIHQRNFRFYSFF